MNALQLSRHAEARLHQRAIRREDVDLVIQCGSLIGDDVYFLSRKNAEAEILRRKREIERLEHLRDYKVVLVEGTIVTAYRSSERDQSRMFRKGRERT